jgi:hypothetical protein
MRRWASVKENLAQQGFEMAARRFEGEEQEEGSGRKDLNFDLLVPKCRTQKSKCFVWCRLATGRRFFSYPKLYPELYQPKTVSKGGVFPSWHLAPSLCPTSSRSISN